MRLNGRIFFRGVIEWPISTFSVLFIVPLILGILAHFRHFRHFNSGTLKHSEAVSESSITFKIEADGVIQPEEYM